MKLSHFIVVNREVILTDWQELVRATSSTLMRESYLRSQADKILFAIAENLALSKTYESAEDTAEMQGGAPVYFRAAAIVADLYGDDQLVSECGIERIVSEFQMLRKSVLGLWRKTIQEIDLSTLDDATRFNDCVDQVLTELVARHTLLEKQSQNLFNDLFIHDLRNPLNAIIMAVEYLVHSNSLLPDHVKIMSQIFESGQEMRGIMSDFLDFSRENFGPGIAIAPVQTNLAVIGRHAVEKIRQRYPDRVVTCESADDLTGKWDHNRLTQAVCNLLENSLQHGSRTAPVTLKIWPGPDDFVLTVHHFGTPIPPDKAQHIFEALRHHSSGSRFDIEAEVSLGLALYVARAIVLAHNGTIEVASASDEGTMFIVRLPRDCTA